MLNIGFYILVEAAKEVYNRSFAIDAAAIGCGFSL